MIDFHAITAEDQKLFRQYVFRSGIQNCDMSFANIFCWQDTYHSELAEHDGFLLTRFLYGENETGYMQPVGSGETRHIVEALREDAAHRGSALRIVGMTPGWRQRIEDSFPGQFAFSDPRSLRDYIYLASDLANLPGRRYQPKRNHINRFLSKYEYRYEPLTGENVADCIELNRIWMSEHGDVSESEHSEQMAMRRAFENFDRLGLRGGVLYADSRIAAFTYGSPVSASTFCTHVEKADVRIEGAAAMINHLFARDLASEYEYINREEDLGIEGLRHSKQSYYPTVLLEKLSARELSVRERQIRELWMNVFGDEREFVDSFLMHHHNPDLCLTCEEDGRVVAMLHVVPMRTRTLRVAYVYAVATDPAYRRRGLASRLTAEAVERIRRSGHYDLAAVIPSGDDSRRIYAAQGFLDTHTPMRFCHEHDFGTGDVTRDIAMTLPLTEAAGKETNALDIVG